MLRVPARVRWHVTEVLSQWSLRSGVHSGAGPHGDAMLHSGGGGVGGWVGGTVHQVASELISCRSQRSWWPPYFKTSGCILMLFPSLFLLVSLKAQRLVQEVGLPRIYLEMTSNRRRCVTLVPREGCGGNSETEYIVIIYLLANISSRLAVLLYQ